MIKFGQKVVISERLDRITEYREIDGFRRLYRGWVSEPLKETIEGIVIGRRTLRNGYLFYIEEGGNGFKETDKVPAYLVATDMRTNPIYVPESVAVVGVANVFLSSFEIAHEDTCRGLYQWIVDNMLDTDGREEVDQVRYWEDYGYVLLNTDSEDAYMIPSVLFLYKNKGDKLNLDDLYKALI